MSAILPRLALAIGVFLLALDSGGYSLITRNAVAIGVWWTILIAVGLSLWPRDRIPATAWLAGGLLAAFAAFTLLSLSWASNGEGAFIEFNRVSLYVGVFAVAALGARRSEAGAWSDGMAIGIAAAGVLALLSRVFPDLISYNTLPALLPAAAARLSYPIGYWNGLAIFVALGIPLLLRIAVTAKSAPVRGLAVLPIPALVSVIYLASSRGGAAVALVGVAAFVVLSSRWAALGASLAAAGGSVAAVAVLLARDQLVNGPLQSAAASSQGKSAALLIALICIAAAGAWALGSHVLARPFSLGRPLKLASIGVVAVVFVVGVIAAKPGHRLDEFKQPPSLQGPAAQDFVRAHLLSGNGSGRWQFWSAAEKEFKTKPVSGRGAGSYAAWWAEHGSIPLFVKDAHSLYLETLGELGVVGLGLLLGALAVAFAAGVRRLTASDDMRVTVAALLAAVLAYAVGAGIDWMWEISVVSLVAIVALGLLAGPATAGVGPDPGAEPRLRPSRPGLSRGLAVTASMLVIGSLAIPLISTLKVQDSQNAAKRGDLSAALSAARSARSVQPWAASPNLQLALITEQLGDLHAADAWIKRAIDRDDADWRLWLVAARIETKRGLIRPALHDLRRAKMLNPRSPLFAAAPPPPIPGVVRSSSPLPPTPGTG